MPTSHRTTHHTSDLFTTFFPINFFINLSSIHVFYIHHFMASDMQYFSEDSFICLYTMFQISVTGTTVPIVSNSELKTPTDAGDGSSDNDNVLKITSHNGDLSSNSVGGIGRKVSSTYQQVLRPSEEQVYVSAVNSRVESNGGSDNEHYNFIKPPHSTSQRISDSGSPTSSDESDSTEEIQDYETGQEYQTTATKGTGSFSYQLIEFGGDSPGTKVSGSVAPVILPIVTEPPNTESENKSGFKGDIKLKLISYTGNENSGLKFGDRIPNVGSDFIQSTGNGQKDQNEIHKGKQEVIEVASLPIPRHSSLRPIIVADIYTKENKARTVTTRPIVVLPTTPASVQVSHSPESASTVLFSESGNTEPVPIVTSKHRVINLHPPSTNILSNSQAVSLAYSAESGSSSKALSSITNNGFSGNVLPQISASHTPLSVAYTKDNTAKQFLAASEGSLSNSTGFVEEELPPHAETLISPTPAPVAVTYPHDISNVQELSAQAKLQGQETSNAQEGPSPFFLYYVTSPYSQAPNPKATVIRNMHRSLGTGLYSTPVPLSSQSRGSLIYSSSEKEAKVPEQSITTTNNGEAGQIIKSENLSPTSEHISHSPKSTSFSVSNSVGNSQSSTSLTTINNADTVHISRGTVYSITPPAVISHSSSNAVSSEGYVVSPDTILLNLNSQPAEAALVSSSEIITPIQAAVSQGTVTREQPTAISTVTSQTPQVEEELEGTPQPRTVVEVQKAVSLDFHSLSLNPGENQKSNSEAPTPGTSVSYSKEVAESGKQTENNNDQHQIITGNLIEYGYGQPLTGLKEYPQLGYRLPHLSGFDEKVLYEYNPQLLEALKLIPQRSHGAVQQGASNEASFGTQKQKSDLSQTTQVTEGEKAGGKYQFNQHLDGNLQPYQQLNNIENQQGATAYNQELNGGINKILGQLLPVIPQSVQTETQFKNYQVSPQIDRDLKYQQPFEVSQKIQNQPPTDISQQVTYHLFGQDVKYKVPVEDNQQIEFLTPVHLIEPVEQAVNIAALQFLPEHNLHITHKIAQGTQDGGQSINQNHLAYASPKKLSEQLQSEYNHQLLEEERQEEVRFSNEIGKALKQVRTEHNGGVGTQVPTHTLKEEVISPPVSVQLPVLTPTTLIHLDTPQQVLELEKPVSIEHTKLVTVEKPVPVHHTKVVEKPIPVPHAVPVEITKLVPVDRPVPFPQPITVPHPVPVPYAVPHPIGVPVPHLVPYPHLVTVPYKEVPPVYFRNGHHVQNFPRNTPLPVILKALQFSGGRYGEPVSLKPHRFRLPSIPQPAYLTPPPLQFSGRGQQKTKHFDNLRPICIEYGFKPPLVPSLQIDEIPQSAFSPSKKD